ncbi:hypothetical protein M441DRAFT_210168 [Trichoderma asperellum CBS 433.97]|uniref:Uncharacterized protein n=1 Tax=Trichoderma asperellum (strain ATCC 204424 / CBS 433.97 / NBRC 101777) TaxID=1042311 RepID=A0A2T3ZMZ2_TRIA4|nr:hypothetical protein M441DRAFT_210168 [Trichoderma asperellum CBS 433.97]PTB46159.1 hypothetical protein M441DRAFT_210168 [Trichoderma asperellum CBS 433.97]
MAQATSTIEKKPDSTHDSGNASQLSLAPLNTETGSSPMASHLMHDWGIFDERSDIMDPPNLSSYQEWVPAENQFYQLDDSYNTSPWLPINPEEALFNSTQATESLGSLNWVESSLASDLLDGSIWSPRSSPRNITNVQLNPLSNNEKLPSIFDKNETHNEAVEDHGSKRRRRSSSTDLQATDITEQRRLRLIIRNLEHFENEQRIYGKRQLRAIKDGLA